MATLDGWLIFAIPYLIIKKKNALPLSLSPRVQPASSVASRRGKKTIYIYIYIYMYIQYMFVYTLCICQTPLTNDVSDDKNTYPVSNNVINF